MLSTKYLYRVEFKDDPDSPVGTPVKFAAVDLGVLTSLDEGVDNNAGILKVSTSERDGNESEPARRDREARAREAEARARQWAWSSLRDYKHSAKEIVRRAIVRVCSSPRSSPPTASWAATASCR